MNNKLKNILIVILSILAIVLSFSLIKSNDKIKDLKYSAFQLENNKEKLLEAEKSSKTDNNITQEETNKLDKSSENIIEVTQKEIFFYNQDDLEKMTGEDISFNNIDSIHSSLCNKSTWSSIGFSEDDSRSIASRFTSSSNQARGILKGITKQDKTLKLILIPLHNGLKVNIASGSPNYK